MPNLSKYSVLSMLALLSVLVHPVRAAETIILQSTTSTANSGLYDHLLPIFKSATGISVNVVAVGTGQAIKNASNGDGDVLLVHAKAAEEEFVAAGFGVERYDVMYNDFVVVGPEQDPAKIGGLDNIIEAFAQIADSSSIFVSRGDNSGTHKKEMELWNSAQVDVAAASGTWYRESGSGMGSTLNVGIGMQAYVLTDRATWISFKNKSNFRVVLEGDARLYNQYGVILVNPERNDHINATAGQRFIDWLRGVEGQAAISSYTLNDKQLFFPNAR